MMWKILVVVLAGAVIWFNGEEIAWNVIVYMVDIEERFAPPPSIYTAPPELQGLWDAVKAALRSMVPCGEPHYPCFEIQRDAGLRGAAAAVRPTGIVVAAGEAVTWRNMDLEPHSVRLYRVDECHTDGNVEWGKMVYNELNGCHYDAVALALVKSAGTYTHTMPEAGWYGWNCIVHPRVYGGITVR